MNLSSSSSAVDSSTILTVPMKDWSSPCFHCRRLPAEHAEGKCLFESTSYSPSESHIYFQQYRFAPMVSVGTLNALLNAVVL